MSSTEAEVQLSDPTQQQKEATPISQSQARVGVGVFIIRASQSSSTSSSSDTASDIAEIEFIIGKRLGSHGSGTWALPGGHLEFGESFEDCAQREVLEETGLEVDRAGLEFLTATNDVMVDDGKHYVTVFMLGRRVDRQRDVEPVICEPEKCQEWIWIRWSEFVRWARCEIEVGKGKGVLLSTGKIGDGKGDDGERTGEFPGKLFSPLLALVQQRPNVAPVWPPR